MAEKMTVAILGLGSRGLQVYAPIIEQNAEKMELTAVADLMEEKVEEAKTRYHLSRKLFSKCRGVTFGRPAGGCDVYLYTG